MGNIREIKLAINISAVILLKKGEISLDDIRSLPFLREGFKADLIVDSLLGMFDAELVCNKIASHPFLAWEEVIRLKSKPSRLQYTS